MLPSYYGIDSHEIDQKLPHLIHPKDLFSADIEYLTDNVENAAFCWRWFKRTNKDQKTFRVITIEGDSFPSRATTLALLPFNFKTNHKDFHEDSANHYFNWRVFKSLDGNEYKVLTLEAEPETIVPVTSYKMIHKMHDLDQLVWCEHAVHDHKDYTFGWRVFERENITFKVVTLE